MSRPIDADALKELFSEVIGSIAKKPEMNGNLEHMIRASAMVIQMIDDAPTVQPDTTTHDSNVVKTGKNDADRTSGDCISRQQAIDTIKKRLFETAFNNVGIKQNIDETLVDVAENRLEKWFNELPSVQPDIIRCKDCAYCGSDDVDAPYGMTKKIFWCDRLYAGANENLVVGPDDFCSWAERREDG